MTLAELKTKKIAIVGMGVNNQKLAEYLLARKIAFEIIKDWHSPDELVGRLDNYNIVFRTPGLPFLSKAIQQAKQKGVIIYSQSKLFFDLCPCPIIGVTGTKGKGTTASLIFEILKSHFQTNPNVQNSKPRVYLAGNIGQDPFEFIDRIEPKDIVVLELSSFQLQDLQNSPRVAVVLKITPEHLDYHESVKEYIEAKKPILKFQSADDWAVINYDQEVARNFAGFTRATKIWNSVMQPVKPGCYVNGGRIMLNSPLSRSGERGEAGEIMPVTEVKLIGRFNLENVTAAIAAASCLGVSDPAVIKKAVSSFEGLPHRLEFVSEVEGVKFYNDSFSTTPETAMAALTAFAEPIVLIAGGSEKNSDYGPLAEAIARSKLKALIPIGLTGPKIANLARAHGFEGRIVDEKFGDMKEIVAAANSLSEPGDVVLLSPASASFDMFSDYKHRGELFRKFVKKLQ